MATLHMDVEVARATERTLHNTESNLANLVSQASQAVGQLQSGSWQGNSATEFYNRYADWKNRCNQLLQELEELTRSLGQEITQWETAAQKLG